MGRASLISALARRVKAADMPQLQVSLTEPQYECVNSQAKLTAFVAGLGSGKTTALAMVAWRHLQVPGAVVGIFAPTYGVLNQATLSRLQIEWEALGWQKNRDYVVNCAPPQAWGVRPFSPLTNTGVLTTRFGSYAILAGLDNFDAQRGKEFDAAVVDEFRDVKDGVLEVLQGRMRGQLYKSLGRLHQLYLFTTPPEDPEFLLRMERESGDLDFNLIQASSYSNPFLPEGYLDGLKATYSKMAFAREVMAELIPLTTNPFAYAFNPAKHVRIDSRAYPGFVYLSFDFNINPATCLAWKFDGTRQAYCLAEFYLRNASLYDLCDAIRAKFPPDTLFFVTGDASGRARQSVVKDLSSFYDVIGKQLQIPRQRLDVPTVNPSHKASWLLCNSLLENFDMSIDPACPELIRDLQFVNYDAGKGIDKSNPSRGHVLDCFRYFCDSYLSFFLKVR